MAPKIVDHPVHLSRKMGWPVAHHSAADPFRDRNPFDNGIITDLMLKHQITAFKQI
jgi:hypothetical protein